MDEFSYQKVILFLNRYCNVGCVSCNAAASPEYKQYLSREWLNSFFERMGNLKFSDYILWTGGEPFLSFDSLKHGISVSTELGYHSEILTSGSWFDTRPELLKILALEGHFSIRISLDTEHQARVPWSVINSLIEKAFKLQLEVNFTLRDIPGSSISPEYYIDEIKVRFPEFYLENFRRSRWIHRLPNIPVCPSNLKLSHTSDKQSAKKKWQQPCQMGFKDLIVGEDGLVYPCCGLFTLHFYKKLSVGDPLGESWQALMESQSGNHLFQVLREKGPYGICRELDVDPEEWEWKPYKNTCHLCLALFNKLGKKIFDIYQKKS